MSDYEYHYLSRLADAELEEKISGVSAVLVRGPKWTGKTSTCKRLAKSALEFQMLERNTSL